MTPRVHDIKVHNIDRACGVRPELKALLDLWPMYGTFDITVAEDGGYRFGPAAERVQEFFFKSGLSKANTLRKTPHGRRCAVDCHPVGFKPNRDFKSQPGMREKFLEWADFVIEHGAPLGIISGGRFKAFGVDGDLPHAEIEGWSKLYSFPSGEPIVPPPEKPK